MVQVETPQTPSKSCDEGTINTDQGAAGSRYALSGRPQSPGRRLLIVAWGFLVGALCAGAGKVSKALKPTTGVGRAETTPVAAVPLAHAVTTKEKVGTAQWIFMVLPALLRTPGIIRAGCKLGSRSLPNIRDIIPMESASEMTEGAIRRAYFVPTETRLSLLGAATPQATIPASRKRS